MTALTSNDIFNWPVRKANCPTHGEYESLNVFGTKWTTCLECAQAKRAAEDARQAAEAEAARKAAEASRWEAIIGGAGIPVRFRDRTLASYVATTDLQRRALGFAQQYADGFDQVIKTGRCALFVGKPGTGKTHLAIGIALAAMAHHNASALFTTTLRALRSVKDTWARGSQKSESEAIDALVFPDLLILDEVGIQFGSDTERTILFDVLNARYESRKPCLLLSNLPVGEVREFLGERIYDRLREDGGEALVFDWPSYRGSRGDAP